MLVQGRMLLQAKDSSVPAPPKVIVTQDLSTPLSQQPGSLPSCPALLPMPNAFDRLPVEIVEAAAAGSPSIKAYTLCATESDSRLVSPLKPMHALVA